MTALVGPLPTVTFGDGTRVVYTVPRDTCDPRHAACKAHRVACDCREAEFAETISELRAMLRDTEKAVNEILAGHQTWAMTETGRDTFAECRCTGCQIVRAADVNLRSLTAVGKEREAAGLPWAIGGEL
jgi:hypothetical protein